jgi:hypothetical protein
VFYLYVINHVCCCVLIGGAARKDDVDMVFVVCYGISLYYSLSPLSGSCVSRQHHLDRQGSLATSVFDCGFLDKAKYACVLVLYLCTPFTPRPLWR